MASKESISKHGTVPLPPANGVWRSVRVLRPLDDLRSAWSQSRIPGSVQFSVAPADRGVDIEVRLDDTDDEALGGREGTSLGQRLESALRDFKAFQEAGEIATIEGQSSGRAE